MSESTQTANDERKPYKPEKYALNKQERRLICAFLSADEASRQRALEILEQHPDTDKPIVYTLTKREKQLIDAFVLADRIAQDDALDLLERHAKSAQRNTNIQSNKCRIIQMPPSKKK